MSKRHTHYDAAEARTLAESNVLKAVMTDGMRFDSVEDASVFFARELDSVKSQSYDVQYPELTALKMFPQTSEADEGAEYITYYTYDDTGLAEIIDNYSNDLPRADVVGKPTVVPIKSLGVSYGYSVQEMRASRLAGKSLDARKAKSARNQNDRKTNIIAWRGDEETGILGILSDGQNIPIFTIEEGATSGATLWKNKTADEILADVNNMAAQVASTTNNVERPDTLLLPADVYMDIATRRIADTSTTVRSFLLEHSPYIKTIESAAELGSTNVDTNPYAAKDGTGSGVAVLYTNDKDKLSLEIPMYFKQYSLQIRNLETVIPCESRLAGMIVYYPLSALIAVGV